MPALVILGDPSANVVYLPVVADDIHRVEIFPPVGIARVGDSEIECFLAPEVPGSTSPPVGLLVQPVPPGAPREFKFRDTHQKLRRQAVRFRVYAYNAAGTLLGELNGKNDYTLNWTVEVANKKAANVVFQRGGRFDPHNTALRNPKVQPNVNLENRNDLIVHATGTIPNEVAFVPLVGQFRGSATAVTNIELAQLQLDNAGRLVFVPGKGAARSVASPGKPHPPMISEFDNADWIDEVCDGWVSVKVTKDDVEKESVKRTRVLSAPPKFTWGINAPTTLFHIMENIYREANNARVPAPTEANLDFWKHIWPVLHSASSMSWTNNTALQGHGSSSNGHYEAQRLFDLFQGVNAAKIQERKQFKSRIFEKLRKPLNSTEPDDIQADARYMPRLSGDAGDMPDPGSMPRDLKPDARRFASLTKLQYDRFKIWKNNDNFHLTTNIPPLVLNLEEIPLLRQTEELTRAILESTMGDPLYPGIEMYWIAKSTTTYDITVNDIDPPFRINNAILPGHLTRGLSLPWQCDFDLCATHWWPAIRPDDIVPKVIYDATVQQSHVKEDFDTAITTRAPWTRGLRETVFFSPEQKDWPGSDDMVRYWTFLGVVREVRNVFRELPGNTDHTAFLEDERVRV